MPSLIIFSLLFILPFIVWPFGSSHFEIPKVILAQSLILILVLTVLFKRGLIFFALSNRIPAILFFLLALLTVAQLVINQTPIALFGNNTRQQGTVLIWLLLLFSLISSGIKLPKINPYIYVCLIGTLLLTSLFLGNQAGRAVATIGEPNALAAYAVFLWPFAFFGDYKKQKLPMRLFSFFAALMIIFLTGSRSGLLAFSIQAIFLFSGALLKIPIGTRVFIALGIITLSFLLPLHETNIYENRAEIWNAALVAGFESPLTGAGFGNTEIALKETSIILNDRLRGFYIDSSHNIFLDFWVQGGFLGLCLFILIIYLSAKHFYYKRYEFEFILLFGVLTSLSFNPGSIVNLLAFWWVLGQGYQSHSIDNDAG